MLNRGPSPASVPGPLPVTEDTSVNESRPESKNLASFVVSPLIWPPAPAAPPRGPGSTCALTALDSNAYVSTRRTISYSFLFGRAFTSRCRAYSFGRALTHVACLRRMVILLRGGAFVIASELSARRDYQTRCS